MRKHLQQLIRLLPIVVSILIMVPLLACSSSYNNTPAPASSTTSPVASGGNSVSIANFAFSPTSITIKVGATITWTNNDSVAHTVTSDSGVFDSGNLAAGKSYTYTFSKAGTFPYHCAVHPSMKASVIVQ